MATSHRILLCFQHILNPINLLLIWLKMAKTFFSLSNFVRSSWFCLRYVENSQLQIIKTGRSNWNKSTMQSLLVHTGRTFTAWSTFNHFNPDHSSKGSGDGIDVGGGGPCKLCACAHMGREMSARKKLGAYKNFSSKSVFAHISYTSFQIQMSPRKMLYKRNYLAHGLKRIKREHLWWW